MNRRRRRERIKNPGKYLQRPPRTRYPRIGEDGQYGKTKDLVTQTTGLPTGMAVTWLGTSSGTPTLERNVSSILLRLPNKTLVFDAGEGTQKQLLKADIFPATIRTIFITHLHGDHCFGLPGLLTLINELRLFHDRDEMLYIYGPPGLHELIKMSIPHWFGRFRMSMKIVEFSVNLRINPKPYPLDPNEKIFVQKMSPTSQDNDFLEDLYDGSDSFGVQLSKSVRRGYQWEIPVGDGMKVTAVQLQHRVPCWGYVVKEPDYVPAPWELDLWRIQHPGVNNDLADDELMKKLSYCGRKVVILGDTCNSDAMVSVGKNADLLSHEATYAGEMQGKAISAQHSTATMAGSFARKLKAKKLVLTHFSPRYEGAGGRIDRRGSNDEAGYLVEQAKDAFGSSKVEAAQDFASYNIPSHQTD